VTDSSARYLLDRVDIIDVILRFARALDLQDWDLCRSCFADEVEADYSELRGTPPSTTSADAFVALRREGLRGLKTQHLSTNHSVTVDGDAAVCVSYLVIFRYKPGDDDTFHTHGYYIHNLIRTDDGWKICKVKQSVFWNTGNPRLHGALR
jgi:3-phenylpropionate/cinnamic acid dioxygenase small subunit